MKLSQRILNVETSQNAKLFSLVNTLKSQGKKIISLNVGEPDFLTPSEIIEATKKALSENKTKYSLISGIEELRSNIASQVNQEDALNINKDNIIISNGSKQSIYNIFQVICDQDDEVIIPAPYWVTFPESIKLAGGKPIIVNTNESHQLNLTKIKKAINKKTKAIVINTPNNPSGAVYSKESLKKIADLAIKNSIYIIVDEAYRFLIYNDNQHISFASINEEIFRHTITIQTFSKNYCMTGFRLGYTIADKPIIQALNKLQSHLTGNVCTFAQYGALAALNMDKNFSQKIRKTFEERLNLSYNLCLECFDCVKPQGAFYLFPSVKKYIGKQFKSCIELAEFLLKEAQVAVVPGAFFGYPDYLRISFASHEDNIKEGFFQIKKVLL